MEKIDCTLCGSSNHKKVFTGSDYLHGFDGNFTIVKCLDCNHFFTNPRPNLENMGSYYPKNYQPFLDTHFNDNSIEIKKSKWFYTGGKEIPEIEPGNLLDIGCASGSFMNKMKQQGWNVKGIEPDYNSVLYCKKKELDVTQKTLDNLQAKDFQKNSFDLITAWMVLEHVHYPKEGLLKIHNLLKPEGYFAFSIPENSSWEFKLFKHRWYATQLPTHLSFFTHKSIQNLLLDTNFQVDKIMYHSNAKNLIKTLILICDKNKFRRIKFLLRKIEKNKLFHVFGIVYGILRQSGRITIWAKKIQK